MKTTLLFFVLITSSILGYSQAQPQVKIWSEFKNPKPAVLGQNGYQPPQLSLLDTLSLKAVVQNATSIVDSIIVSVHYDSTRTKLFDSTYTSVGTNPQITFNSQAKYLTIPIGEYGYRSQYALTIQAFDKQKNLLYNIKSW